MRPPIDGGVVLVTGASSGIGRELARLLGARARRLVLVARRADRLEALRVELLSAHPKLTVDLESVDLSDRAATVALAERLLASGGVDVLVNNAGLGDVQLFDRAELSKLEQLLRVNVDAVVLLTKLLLPPMLARGRGGILNVSSGWGLTFGPLLAVYTASKHFVTAFTEGLRIDLAGTGVVVSQVCPGPIPTEFEAVAGNPVGRPVPSIVQISARRCAEVAVRGFSRGRALIMPGFLIANLTRLGMATPRVVLRAIYGLAARLVRRRAP